MKPNKNRKRKFALSIKIAAMLSCIAIASVGFASWLIVTKPVDQNAAGSITASTVSTEGLDLSAKWVTMVGEEYVAAANPIINFGTPAGWTADTQTDSWLQADEKVKPENLSATLEITYTPYNYNGTLLIDFAALVGTTETPTRLTDLFGEENAYASIAFNLTGVSSENVEGGTFENGAMEAYKIAISESDKATVTLYLTITFDWGTKFGNQNPYTYANTEAGKALTAAQKVEVATALQAIYDAINGENDSTDDDLTFKVTVSTTTEAEDQGENA